MNRPPSENNKECAGAPIYDEAQAPIVHNKYYRHNDDEITFMSESGQYWVYRRK
jgi:hypothetical protein